MTSFRTIIIVLVLWEIVCRIFAIPAWLLPRPTAVALVLQKDAFSLIQSFLFTAKITLGAFFLAILTGFFIGVLAHISKFFQRSFFPLTILLQTTPIVSIAPVLIIWFRNNAYLALLTCAWLVCVYPMISSTYSGLSKVDANLMRIFSLYNSSFRHRLWHLELPSALPYIANGLRITGGLALVGAIGAEFVAGTGGQELGLAYRLLMAAYNQETARLFAVLTVVSIFGLFLHFVLFELEKFIVRKLRLSASPSSTI